MDIIVLAGMPASGKSTVAAKLSAVFSLPVLAKDELKEALFDTVGFSCYAEKRKKVLADAEYSENEAILQNLEEVHFKSNHYHIHIL